MARRDMCKSARVKENLGKMLEGVILENLALVSKKGRIPVPVATHKPNLTMDEVSYIAEAAMKYDANYGGLKKGMTEEKLTRMLLREPEPYYGSSAKAYAASIFAVSIVGLLVFTNYGLTGAVIGAGSVEVVSKLAVGLAAVAFAFFIFKVIKK